MAVYPHFLRQIFRSNMPTPRGMFPVLYYTAECIGPNANAD